MATVSVTAADLARLIKSVERSAARDDARPVLAGIHATIDGASLILTAADGFRLTTAHGALTEPAEVPASAILERAGLLAFGKSLKPKLAPLATIETGHDAWTFAANGTRATVRLIDGDYPQVAQLLPNGDEPTLFCANAQFLAQMLAAHGDAMVRVSRGSDDASAPLFFTSADGTVRHVIMPMVAPASVTTKRREDAPATEQPAHDATPAPVTTLAPLAGYACLDCGSHEIDAAPHGPTCTECGGNAEPMPAEVMAHESAHAATATDALSCPECGCHLETGDRFCAECGLSLTSQRPGTMADTLAAFSPRNQKLILNQCPHATDVRGFRAWIDAGRVVRKGQKGIRIVAPNAVDGETGRVTSIKPLYVFDLSQTDALPAREDATTSYAAAD